MAKHKLFCVPGTWEAVAAANGDPNIFRAVKTAFDLGVFLRDFPHDKYGIWEIIPGWTALRHSANHLNFWGPRLPTTIDV